MTKNNFEWLNKQTVRHKSGYVVKSAGRFNMSYHEKGKTITLDVENGYLSGRRPCVEISPGSFLHYDGEDLILSSEDQERIQKNFKAGVEEMGLALVVAVR